MRILIVSQYFHPENFRVNDLALWLVKNRHQVTVLTGLPNYPSGRFFQGYGFFRRWREVWNGIEITRVPLFPRGKGGRLRLSINYLSFALSASLLGPWRVGRAFDVIFVHEPSPITVGIPAVVIRKRSGAPMLLWILDLWPESVSAAGGVTATWLLNMLVKLTRWIYRYCDRVLVQSRAFIPRVQAMGVPLERISYLPNWAEDVFNSGAAQPPAISLPAGFRVMYAGNIGFAQDFPAILGAAERLKDETDIHWIILGDGREMHWVREEIKRRGLERAVYLLGSHPPERMPDFFACAGAMLVSLRSNPVFSLTVPAKLQAYLAYGRPIVAMLDGEGARIVMESGAGLACAAGDSAALATAVRQLARLSDGQRAQMGARGREYYVAHFEREKLLRQLEEWMVEAARGDANPSQSQRSTAKL